MLPDAVIIPNFLFDQLGETDAAEVFKSLQNLLAWPDDECIPYAKSVDPTHGNDDVRFVNGTHSALNFRGRDIKRSKVWLQRNLCDGHRRYGYTGWQWKVAAAARDITAIPIVADLLENLNQWLNMREGCEFNHVIATLYKDGNDNIGYHSDKEKDFEEDCWFCVVKLGAPRPFNFCAVGDDSKKKTAIFSETLQAGSAIFVRCKTLGVHTHARALVVLSCSSGFNETF
jgi:alkylated DNA repair dioxygenase AlkB